MFIWIKYGFEEVPPRMFNSNVTCDILLGFVRASFLKEVDDICKQRSLKLSIDIEGVKKQREAVGAEVGSTSVESVSPSSQDLGGMRPVIPRVGNVNSCHHTDWQVKLEAQLEALLAISKSVKDLQSVNALDVVDESGQRLKLNDRPRDRAMDILKPRQVYQLVKLGDTPEAPPTPLKFALPAALPSAAAAAT
ncbi:hypothetical protein H257_08816 [Aphanomyces astaci]|uniref:Uncharacterized protein n=1 Tax=Aphanomyces astaci TaxID=112090 RepID=W4GE87_APHAT|nr:hypothetical protein H257_08816 [Aphanomyces astaci]ETV77389.1 hypothetical protein H257_08816 [Aphanomyces astaci]|eukprot:XP_009833176.1 hypothetical protein H257_08816 [Aphanomyces astaci]